MPSKQPERRLRDIVVSIDAIFDYVDASGGVEPAIEPNTIQRDAIERRLLIIAEAAVKLRDNVESAAPEIDWAAMRGMGNVLRHNYDDIETEVIRRVLSAKLTPLKSACERLLEAL